MDIQALNRKVPINLLFFLLEYLNCHIYGLGAMYILVGEGIISS